MTRFLVPLILLTAASVSAAPPAALRVHPGLDPQTVIDAAAERGIREVVFSSGVYAPREDRFALLWLNAKHRGVSLRADGEVILRGASADGKRVAHILYLGDGLDGTTRVSGFTFTGATGFVTAAGEDLAEPDASLRRLWVFYGDGGAVKVAGDSSPVLEGNRFVDNHVYVCGAAVSVEHMGRARAPVVLRRNVFAGNSVHKTGAAVDVLPDSRVVLRENVFRDNITGAPRAERGKEVLTTARGPRRAPALDTLEIFKNAAAVTVFKPAEARIEFNTFDGNTNDLQTLADSAWYWWKHAPPAERARPSGIRIRGNTFTGGRGTPGSYAVSVDSDAVLADNVSERPILIGGAPAGVPSASGPDRKNMVRGFPAEEETFIHRGAADRCAEREGVYARAVAHHVGVLSSTAPARTARDSLAELTRLYLAEYATLDLAVETAQRLIEFEASRGLPPTPTARLLQGAALVHKAKYEECVLKKDPDRCVFPFSGGTMRGNAALAAARRTLLDYLREVPDDADARLLLNLAAHAAGDGAAGVPEDLRLPDAAFSSDEAFPRLRDRGPRHGMLTLEYAGGVSVDDFNGDGHLDMIIASRENCQPLRYFESNGKNGFRDRSADSGLAGQRGVTAVLQADFDNDGDLDLYLTNGAWYTHEKGGVPLAPVYNVLMRNDGAGRFTDVTRETGLRGERNTNIGSAWGDFDNDGRLDLFVCNERRGPDLFRNAGGRFIDVAGDSGIVNTAICKSPVWIDVDNDGWLDLYLSNYLSPNKLYMNNRDGSFRDATTPELAGPHHGFVAWAWDFDNDGWLDLNVNAFAETVTLEPGPGERGRIFMNSRGVLRDAAPALGYTAVNPAMGSNMEDLDGDGFLDLYLGTGRPHLAGLVPNRLYRNLGGKRLVDVTIPSGLGQINKGHGAAFGDLDNDGDQDLLVNNGGRFDSDAFYPSLFINPGAGNHWVTLRLEGVKANRSAIGSRIKITACEGDARREIHRLVSLGGTFGSNSLQVEVGLGGCRTIESIEVRWAGSGTVDVWRRPAADRFYAVQEGAHELRELRLRKLKL